MRPGYVPVAVLLLLATGTVLQVLAEDIYWEGEDDAKNEYLEVKEDEGIAATLRRVRRNFNIFDLFRDDKKPDTNESDGHIDEDNTTDPDDDNFNTNHGSGALPEKDPDFREKTLRVSFVVMEPYQLQYSNRDSEEFRNLSKSLADAVNVLFESLPGTQRASLVRIQSRISDDFSCKVTLDISTIGYENIPRITNILRTHISTQHQLGSVIVSDTDFSATPIDPGYLVVPECASDEFPCNDGRCVLDSLRCNGTPDCYDGSDELDCRKIDTIDAYTTTQLPEKAERNLEDLDYQENHNISDNEVETDTEDPNPDECREPVTCNDSYQTYCPEQRCDGVRDCPRGDDELNCETNTSVSPTIECEDNMFQCDHTRCVLLQAMCDGIADCDDGKDEDNCKNQDLFKGDKKPDTNENDGHIDEDNRTNPDDDTFNTNQGSRAHHEKEPDFREKTLRVSFVVMEPYQLQYSNRDSEEFRNLSKSLGDAVNVLFESLPGTQRASLVRIQSRISDAFSCKVTLDISTIGYENIPRITNILRTHISTQHQLGSVIVSDTDFSATPIDPECEDNMFQCDHTRCVLLQAMCDGIADCDDGKDEDNCKNQGKDNGAISLLVIPFKN